MHSYSQYQNLILIIKLPYTETGTVDDEGYMLPDGPRKYLKPTFQLGTGEFISFNDAMAWIHEMVENINEQS